MKRTANFKEYYTTLSIGLIILFAFVVRIANITQIPHYIDNAYPIWQALLTIDRGIFPLIGQMSSIGIVNPPFTGYLYLPVVALTRSPIAVYAVVIFLNSLAIWFCYRLAREHFGIKAGLIAAILMAVNPWLIEYSRFTWVQSLMPFFMSLLAWLFYPLLLGTATHPLRRTLMVMALVTLIAGTYLLAFLIVLPVGLLMLIFYRRVRWRGVLIGSVLFGIMSGLYAVGVITQTQTDTGFIGQVASNTSTLNTVSLGHAIRFVTGEGYALRVADTPQIYQHLEGILSPLILIAMLAGIGLASIAIWKRTLHRNLALILLVWAISTILPLSYNSQPVQVHYQLVTLPVGYMLTAWGSTLLLKRRIIWLIPFIILLPFSVVMLSNALRYTSQQADQTINQDLVRPPLGIGLEIGQIIRDNLTEGGVVYVDSPQEVIMSLAGRLFPMVRYQAGSNITFIPRDGGLYIATANRETALPRQPLHTQKIASLEADNGMIVEFYSPPLDFDTDETINKLHIPSQQGMTFLGYTLTLNENRNRWRLYTYWMVEGIPDIVYDFGSFVHLIEANGTRTILDGELVPTSYWREGDIHIHMHRFQTRQAFTLRIGQYDATKNENLIFQLPDGTVAPFIEIEGTAQ